ncbi:MAG: ABC transporter permease [Bacteroidales bacterium]|jgi:putative ABC transport system permease protein|nr:ABC transporter permease [Bacteroidales bacterium]MCI2121239.1 ABC transporter permease [Bacteroidales bacterium]MCI2145971.1 ABC transporter permease [Bacteroidales bacterium]
MNFGNLIKIALKALGSNRMRTFLTMLGIIIGVGSVITMLAIGTGSKQSIRSEIGSMGTNVIMVMPGNGHFGGVRQSASSMQTLKLSDYRSLANETSYLSHITPVVDASGQAIFGAENTPTTLYGVNGEYLDIHGYALSEGTVFTDEDIKKSAKVCLIGATVAKNLFGKEDPLGKVIRFSKIPFKIIGVLESKGSNTMGMDQDDLLLAPYTTVQKRILAITYLNAIHASAISEDYSTQAINEITKILQINHGIEIGEENDFNVRSMQEMLKTMSSVMDLLTILLGCVAGISLIVGGIGIMNIMYVSVTERTKEIGLRMAIGAKGKYIMIQFLIEAIFISVLGGIIGVIIGILAAKIIELLGTPTSVSAFSIVLSFLVCVFTGIFFGWYPARKAARLNPIDAIRYE